MINAVSHRDPKSPMAEAYRAVAAGFCGAVKDSSPIIIEITSAVSSAGKSTIAANLAIVIAQAGKKVLLVDCNLSNPAQHEIFNLKVHGLSDCVASGGDLSAFRQATAQTGLELVAAGVNAPVAISPETVRQMLDILAAKYDYILLDAASVLGNASALSFASAADGVLLVVKSGEDRPEDARLAKKRLAQTKTPILGCVLNCVKVDDDDISIIVDKVEANNDAS